MSKNVAVFVDVANIFYAAKAAGVDIDYVTLLKAATAGRDFVRAYAYTGLDPENENQRQFHAFLARSGYKVISKDIRKYGDGRIKANLDIELVVDMMKTARNLDIAVVVSGDGDFASAIRAVQEMGVRVEVISFRGNTSSDLIDVADLFTDIAQIARVDKGARSGRRVAAEGDLSMTEVPEKETEGAPRRRRGGRPAREERPAAEAEDKSGNLVVLPGERLSRAGEGEEETGEGQVEEAAAASADGQEAVGEDGRRRRRRRGGRGRGRGRRTGEEVPVGASEPGDYTEDEEDFEELPPPQVPHQTFGSVWDSQLGVPTAPMPPSVELSGVEIDEDEEYAEPEVPEYLLAERRQGRGRQAGRGRQGRGRGAYQAALDRERFGRGSAQPSYGSSSSPNRGRDRGRQQSRPQSGNRSAERAPRPSERPAGETSSEPWTEVPPELEEMLRAELARKQPAASAEAETVDLVSAEAADAGGDGDEPAAAKAPAKRTTRSRATKATARSSTKAAAEKADAGDAADGDGPAAVKAPAKRTTRSRTTKTTARSSSKSAAKAEPSADSGDEAAPAEEPKKPVRRRRTTATAASAEES